ncbi:MAG: hypothetical protein LBD18_02085 [Treponema sp.]|nr:hypothetical protein [Treponema sp.]
MQGIFYKIISILDREDKISVFCLITAAFTIEQYCLWRLFMKRHFERIAYNKVKNIFPQRLA